MYILPSFNSCIHKNGVFMHETCGKQRKSRVKISQRGTCKNMHFVETKQFQQKDLLFREKNAIMSVCICGFIHQYRSACLYSRFQAYGNCRILYIIYL